MIRLDNIGALDRLQARFAHLQNPDATGLMVTWQQVIVDDTRKGVLAGTDKDGRPLIPVTYRPDFDAKGGTSKSQRYGQRGNKKFGDFNPMTRAGFGNLTSREYRKLTGPPLAPRGQFSRVVTNLLTRYRPAGNGRWEAEGYWDQVVSRQGVPFLRYHFDGEPLGRGGPRKQRDLRGVRPAGVALAKEAAVNWMRDMVRSGGV